jgi:hypothetical protein
MKKPKRPKTIIVLMVIYVYLFVSGLSKVFLFSSNPDYYFFSQAGVGYLYLVLTIPILIITGLTIQFLWKPKPIGLWIALFGLALHLLNDLVSFFIAVYNPELMKQAYILSREARGAPVRPENIERMFSQTGIFITFGIAIGLTLLLAVLFIWKRDYFLQQETKLLEDPLYT